MPKQHSAEEQELQELWSLFQDSPEDVQLKRKEITKKIKFDKVSEFPSTLLIFTATDELLSCFAITGQLKSYYRYGSYDLCARQREKFWFAMRNGSFSDSDSNSPSDLQRKAKIQEFYKKRLLEDKAMGSSEDIWNLRKKE